MPSNSSRKAMLNRELLSRLVDVAILAIKLDRSVEYLGTDWLSAEKFLGLFNAVIAERTELMEHCRDMGNAFTAMIRTFFPDFLDHIQEEIQLLGYLEIVHCSPQPLCAIQLDSVRDVDAGKNALISISHTYIDKEGDLQQHFFGFESNATASAASVGQHVDIAMARYRHNLVSQSYDGACVSVDQLTGLRKKIQASAPCALLIPSVDHPLTKVLMQGVFNVRGAQLFVATLYDLADDPARLATLQRLKDPSVCVAKTDRCVDSKLCAFLLDQRESFVSAFDRPPSSVGISLGMCVAIKRLVDCLQDLTFVFLLFAFVDILEVLEELDDVLRPELADVDKCTGAVKRAIVKLKLLTSGNNSQTYVEKANKCVHILSGKAKPSGLVTLFNLIVENIVLHVLSRFGNVQQLEFLQLTDSERFGSYENVFPDSALATLGKLYGNHFAIPRLEKELRSFVYRDPRFRSLPALGVVKLIREMGLREAIPQAYKLFCLVATLPVAAAKGRDCLKQITSFMAEARTHSFESYENHRALPVVGLNTVLFKHAQVVIEKPLVLDLVSKKAVRDNFMQQYIKGRVEAGFKFDCTL